MEPLISVVIPAYNAEPHIARCLDSVFSQTFRQTRVIVVDDGSKDRTGEILKEYQKHHSSLTVITQENGGVSKARNTGIDEVDTEYMTFIDSDDSIDTDFLSTLYRCASEQVADIVICGCKNIDSGTGKTLFTDSPLDRGFTVNGDNHIVFWGAPWGKLMKTALVKGRCYFTEGVLFEDDPYSIMLHSIANRVLPIGYIGYNYYINNPSSYMGREQSEQRFIKEFPYAAYENALKTVYDTDDSEKLAVCRVYYLRMMMSIILKKCRTDRIAAREIVEFHYQLCNTYSMLTRIKDVRMPIREKLVLSAFRILTMLRLLE